MSHRIKTIAAAAIGIGLSMISLNTALAQCSQDAAIAGFAELNAKISDMQSQGVPIRTIIQLQSVIYARHNHQIADFLRHDLQGQCDELIKAQADFNAFVAAQGSPPKTPQIQDAAKPPQGGVMTGGESQERITPAQAVNECTSLTINDASGESLRQEIAKLGGTPHGYCTCLASAVLAARSTGMQSGMQQVATANYLCLSHPEEWISLQ
jgi:hypothetical protein